MRMELLQEEIDNGHKTLCIDIENVFVRKVNIMDIEELSMLQDLTKFEDYILVDKSYKQPQSEHSEEMIANINMKFENEQKLLTELI
jgi:hypothetical protein